MTLREARKAKGLTLAQAAEKIGCDLAALQKWETKKRDVPAGRVQRISSVLGVPPESIRPDIFAAAATP